MYDHSILHTRSKHIETPPTIILLIMEGRLQSFW